MQQWEASAITHKTAHYDYSVKRTNGPRLDSLLCCVVSSAQIPMIMVIGGAGVFLQHHYFYPFA